jgi:hypothetical protein
MRAEVICRAADLAASQGPDVNEALRLWDLAGVQMKVGMPSPGCRSHFSFLAIIGCYGQILQTNLA